MIYLDRINNTLNHEGQENIGMKTNDSLQLDMIFEIVWCVKETLNQLHCLGSEEILV